MTGSPSGRTPQEKNQPNNYTIRERKAKLRELLEGNHSPFHIVKRILDIWCALWFWPIQKADQLPDYEEWIAAVEDLVKAADVDSGGVSGAEEKHPWLSIVKEVAEKERFHHWELIFGEVFEENGGFDVILGNPPWVPVEWEERDVLGEFDPLIELRKEPAGTVARKRADLLRDPSIRVAYLDLYVSRTASQAYFSSPTQFPELQGSRANLYKCFIARSWYWGSEKGQIGLLHPEGVYDEAKGGVFGACCIRGLWRIISLSMKKSCLKISPITSGSASTFIRSGPRSASLSVTWAICSSPRRSTSPCVTTGWGPFPATRLRTINGRRGGMPAGW